MDDAQPGRGDAELQPVDHVISLGTNCEITFNLRRFFGVERAYPFDWWITPLAVVAPILLNRFAVDIDSDNLEVVGGGQSILNRKYRILHHHDFPRLPGVDLIAPDWTDALDGSRSKIEALGRRFFDDLTQARRALFFLNRNGVHGFLDERERLESRDARHYRAVECAIEQLFPDLWFRLVVAEPDVEPPEAIGEGSRMIYLPRVKDYGDRFGDHPEHFAGSLRGWSEALSTLAVACVPPAHDEGRR